MEYGISLILPKGAPSERIWPGWTRLPKAAAIQPRAQPYNYLKQHFPKVGAEGVELLNHLLTYDPVRVAGSASQCVPCCGACGALCRVWCERGEREGERAEIQVVVGCCVCVAAQADDGGGGGGAPVLRDDAVPKGTQSATHVGGPARPASQRPQAPPVLLLQA